VSGVSPMDKGKPSTLYGITLRSDVGFPRCACSACEGRCGGTTTGRHYRRLCEACAAGRHRGGAPGPGELLEDVAEALEARDPAPLDVARVSHPMGAATGELCPFCGGLQVRTGTCLTCQGCGASSGCG